MELHWRNYKKWWKSMPGSRPKTKVSDRKTLYSMWVNARPRHRKKSLSLELTWKSSCQTGLSTVLMIRAKSLYKEMNSSSTKMKFSRDWPSSGRLQKCPCLKIMNGSVNTLPSRSELSTRLKCTIKTSTQKRHTRKFGKFTMRLSLTSNLCMESKK